MQQFRIHLGGQISCEFGKCVKNMTEQLLSCAKQKVLSSVFERQTGPVRMIDLSSASQ